MISVKNIAKTYPGLTVFRDVSVEIEKGDVISIIGPSGTGKSTFLRCLNLLEAPDCGQILIDGEDILAPKADVNRLRRKMGMVFQSFNLFSHLTIIENIMLGPTTLLKTPRQEAYEDGIRLLDMVGLASKAFAYPDELSGGQKQRVAIARTLAMHPEVILFDEPTSALDPTMVREVLAVIKRLAMDGLTMLIVTHEMSFARDVSTRVFYMDECGIYEQGTPEQIFSDPQRPKTREFINKIQTCAFTFDIKETDLYAINASVEIFMEKLMLERKKTERLLLVIEELLLNRYKAIMKQGEITLTVGYQDDTKSLELSVTSVDKFDPFAATDAEDMSAMILNHYILEHKISKSEGGYCAFMTIRSNTDA